MLIGDVFDRLAEIPDGSVDLVLTSPPFLALRSYLPPDHPDKAKEIGSEPTPAAFIDTLLRLTAEWRRVLAPHGSIAVELGDTYSGGGGAGGDYAAEGLRAGQQAFSGSAAKRAAAGIGDEYRPSRAGRGDGWPLAKSLTLIPELYRLGLAYGVNALTGQPSPAGQWRVRNVVRWVRPNPPVGALGDKFRPATSDMVIACTSAKRWFDLTAVRTPHQNPPQANHRKPITNSRADDGQEYANSGNPAGAPPLDWWKISPGGYEGSHYAVYPPELCVTPILAMCPQHVCRACGEPRRRIEETTYVAGVGYARHGEHGDPWNGARRGDKSATQPKVAEIETLGWTDCGHDDYRPGLVLDPFGGSGTTGMVATGHGRDALLIDIDARNADLARERIGMFLTVHEHGDAYRRAA